MAIKSILICDICRSEVDMFMVSGNPNRDLGTKAFKRKILIGQITNANNEIRSYGLDLVLTSFDNDAGMKDICFSCLTQAIVSLGEEMTNFRNSKK